MGQSRKLKLSLGRLAGAAVRLPGDARGPLLLAEGFETGASCWYAAEYETWAELGSIAKAQLDGVPVSRLIIVCADDDALDAPSNKALKDAIRGWRREGRRVMLVKPWELTRGDKTDFNDALREEGREAVRKRIQAALETMSMPVLPSVKKARQDAARAIDEAMAELRSWHASDAEDEVAPFLVGDIAFGIGKTQNAIEHIIAAVNRCEQVAFLVPTHNLSTELVKRIEDEARRQGVEVVVHLWRGREAPRPDAPDQTMCAELTAVREAQAAYADVAGTVCKVCPNRETCSYLAQGRRVARVWIGAHELLLHPPPAPLEKTNLLVIDEGFTNRIGYIGISGSPVLLTAKEILAYPLLDSVSTIADLVTELMPVRRALAEALDSHPAGALQRQRLLDAGLTAEDCAKARALEWDCVERIKVVDGMPWSTLVKRVQRAAELARTRGIRKRLLAWRVAEELILDQEASGSGRAVWGKYENDGIAFDALQLYGLEPINAAWFKIPALHLDATVRMDLLKLRVPHARLIADIAAETPHMRVVQYTGKSFSKGTLAEGTTLDKVWSWSLAYASKRGGDWLIVMSKDAAEAISKPIPAFIRLAHFNTLRGIDAYGHVAGIIIIGRPSAAPSDVERLASITTGREVEHHVAGWYPSAMVHLYAKDGTAATVEADRHPDALTEEFRAAIAEDELLQDIARPRAVNRTAADPVEVILLGNVPVPGLALDSVRQWEAPGIDDEILAKHGVVFEAAAHAAIVAGLTPAAVKLRRKRQSLGSFSNKDSLLENDTKLSRARYQLLGTARRRHRVLYDARRIPDIKVFLLDTLGPLTFFEGAVGEVEPNPVEAVIEQYREGELAAEPALVPDIEESCSEPCDPPTVEPSTIANDEADKVSSTEQDELFAERAALIENLAGVCREIAEAFARLNPDSPRGDIPPRAWADIIDGAGRFIDSPMLANALALGWTAIDLFGCDNLRPYARIDQTGLLLDLRDGRVVVMTERLAIIEKPDGTRHTWPRLPRNPGRPLIWEVAESRRRATQASAVRTAGLF